MGRRGPITTPLQQAAQVATAQREVATFTRQANPAQAKPARRAAYRTASPTGRPVEPWAKANSWQNVAGESHYDKAFRALLNMAADQAPEWPTLLDPENIRNCR
jgi:hypothetical protein